MEENKINPGVDRLCTWILAIAAVVVILTCHQYGICWDEPAQHGLGLDYWHVYTSLLHDRMGVRRWDRIYGGFYEMPAVAISQYFPTHIYDVRHYLNAFTGLIGILGCWKLGRMMGGSVAGLLTLCTTLLFPSYIGHMFNNSKDIPFAAAYIWAVFFMIKVFYEFPDNAKTNFVKFGLTAGATAGVRVGGMVLFPIFGFTWILYFLIEWFHRTGSQIRADVVAVFRLAIVSFILGYGLMCLFWPWAQLNPVTHPFQALKAFSNFQGIYIGNRWYALEALSLKVPDGILVGTLLAVFLILYRLKDVLQTVRSAEPKEWGKFCAYGALVSSFTLPIAFVIIKRSNLYNEIRQIIFVVLPLIVGTSITLTRILEMTHNRILHALWVVGIMGFLALPAWGMYKLFPYEYIYVNALAGRLKRTNIVDLTCDYELHSLRALAGQLKNYLLTRDGDRFWKTTYTVFIHGPAPCMSYYLPMNIRFVDEHFANEAQFGVFCDCEYQEHRPYNEIGQVSRDGVPLTHLVAYEPISK